MLIDPFSGDLEAVGAERMAIRGTSVWSSRWDHQKHAAAARREAAMRRRGMDHLGLRLSLTLPCNIEGSVVE